MKVTVTFGRTVVVVPCKDGWTVRDLILQATLRYRKVLDQEGDFAVRTHHVKYADGGILDQDDLLCDLVEDRDKLVAVFEQQELQRVASVSPAASESSGTSGPESDSYEPLLAALEPMGEGEIEVTATTLQANTPLLVRSSSDSALAPPLQSTPPPESTPPLVTPSPQPDDLVSSRTAEQDASSHLLKGGASDRLHVDIPTGKMKRITTRPLTRTVELTGHSGPLGIHIVPYCSSLSGRRLGLLVKGMEENSRARREGLFQTDECIVRINDTHLMDKAFAQSQEVFVQAMSSSVVRLEVLPVANKQRYEKSLIGQLFSTDDLDLKARSPQVIRAKMDAKLDPKPDAKLDPKPDIKPVIKLDPKPDIPLDPKTDIKPDIQLDPKPVIKLDPKPDIKPDIKLDPKPVIKLDPKPDIKLDPKPDLKLDPKPDIKSHIEPDIKPHLQADQNQDLRPDLKPEERRADMRMKTPEPPHLPPLPAEPRAGQSSEALPPSSSPTPRGRSESPLPRRSAGLPGLVNQASRKGGRKMKIDLKKGTDGLGFTVVTRDSLAHGPGPIMVKNILARGAAIKDGRLQPGDRILEVNGVDMSGRTQEELVAMLRSTRQGESVSVVIVRQEEMFLPRELKGEEAPSLVLEDGKEQLVLEVPLNDSGSAGLGVSLKGNKSRETGEDLGIFIKSIIHGGAAYKDGRLRVNDQLVAVNGESLQGHSNHAAMETLRHSMSWEGTARGTIQLVLLRAAPRPHPDPHPDPQQESQEVVNLRSWTPDPGPGPPEPASGPPDPTSGPPEAHTSLELSRTGPSLYPMEDNQPYHSSGAPLLPISRTQAPVEDEQGVMEDFPPPPSPGAVEEMNAGLTPLHPREMLPCMTDGSQTDRQTDPRPQSRSSKCMDLVADESNMEALVRQSPVPEPARGGARGPSLGLAKSSSLESLLTAVSEASHSHATVPFHRPRPNMARGRGCNQSFRFAIDKSYDGPSEDDDDLSEASSGRDTPAGTSSRHDLDEGKKEEEEEGGGKRKKKTKGRKKEKKSKGKREEAEDPERKSKKRGFGLWFGKRKEEKNKAAKQKLGAVSEDEMDKIQEVQEKVRQEPRYTEVRAVHSSPERPPLPLDLEDDDHDPNYARINNFRQPPSPRVTHTPSPTRALIHNPPPGPSHARQPSAEDLEGLYAKVNKQRLPGQNQPPRDSDWSQQPSRQPQQIHPAPAYEELDALRHRAPNYDHPRVAGRGADTRPAPRYEELDRNYTPQPRRVDPSHQAAQSRSRSGPREPASYPIRENDPPSQAQHLSPIGQAPRHNHVYETVGEVGPRQASPGRYTSPERYGYREGRQRERRPKNPMVGAV